MLIHRFNNAPITKFYLEFFNKKMSLYFDSYFDEKLKIRVYKENVFIIYDWDEKTATVEDYQEKNIQKFEESMGIIIELREVDLNDNVLKIVAERIDGCLIEIILINAKIAFEEVLK